MPSQNTISQNISARYKISKYGNITKETKEGPKIPEGQSNL